MEQLEKDIIKIIMKEMIYNNNDIDPKKVQECLYSLKDKDDDYEDKIEFDSLKSKEEKIIQPPAKIFFRPNNIFININKRYK